MKKCMVIMLLLSVFLTWPGLLLRAAEIPQNVTLRATVTTIEVTWTGVSVVERYYVYWGTTAASLSNRVMVDASENSHIITGLQPGTLYFAAVSSFSGEVESQKSPVKSITTTQDNLAPDVPSGLRVTALSAITENSVVLRWDANSEKDLSYYNVYYGTAPGIYNTVIEAGKNETPSFTVTGLNISSRYYFAVSAVDESENESDVSDEIIVDTLPDTRPPNVPSGVTARMSDFREITIRIGNGNSAMVDFAGHIIYYGVESDRYSESLDIGKNMSHVFVNVQSDQTWYFSVTAYDVGGNESGRSAESSVAVEDTRGFLDKDTFDGGCFIASTGNVRFMWGWGFALLWVILFPVCIGAHRLYLRRRMIALVNDNPGRTLISLVAILMFVGVAASDIRAEEGVPGNMAGVSAGWLIPAESEFEDYYGDDTYPVFAFFERRFGKYFSVAVESGFMKKTGKRMTLSGSPTEIETKFTLVPVTASLKLHMELLPYIYGFIGAGPDYWYCREKTKINVQDAKIEEWVGGWHGRAGLMLYNMDARYEGSGAVIEAVYSEIDRFGENSRDIGGVTLRLGLFYGF